MLRIENTKVTNLADESANSAGLSEALQGKLLEFREWQSRSRRPPAAFKSVDGDAQGLVHDMNNLLMVIGGFADVACCDPEISPRSRLALENVMTATRKATYLAKQILSEARQVEKEIDGCNIASALGEAVDLVSPLLGSEIKLQLSDIDSRLLAKCDPEQFSRAITNLLLNARDALPDGGTISVTADEQSLMLGEKQEYVRIRVQDDGIGMDAATQARIFEPCFSTKGAEKGSGIGLHMVSGFVKDCDGYLSLDSEKGRGSTFALYLPIHKFALNFPVREINPTALPGGPIPTGTEEQEEAR